MLRGKGKDMIQLISLIGFISGIILGLMMVMALKYSEVRLSSQRFNYFYLFTSILSFIAGALSLIDMILQGFGITKFIATIILFMAASILLSHFMRTKGY